MAEVKEKPNETNVDTTVKEESTKVKVKTLKDLNKDLKEIVVIKRLKQSRIPESIFADAVREIGGGMTRSGDVQRGLPLQLEKFVFPTIVGVSHTDPSFASKVKTWYNNISIKVPEQGLELNKATIKKEIEIDGETVLVNFPVDPIDFIKYNIAKDKRYVASSEEEAKKLPDIYEYFIEDKSLALKALAKKQKDEFSAMAAYQDIAKKASEADEAAIKKVISILELTKDIHRDYSFRVREVPLQLELIKKVYQEDPSKFNDIIGDELLDIKSMIYVALDKEVLTASGNSIFYDREIIGDSIEQAAIWLNTKTNSSSLLKIKAKLKELS